MRYGAGCTRSRSSSGGPGAGCDADRATALGDVGVRPHDGLDRRRRRARRCSHRPSAMSKSACAVVRHHPRRALGALGHEFLGGFAGSARRPAPWRRGWPPSASTAASRLSKPWPVPELADQLRRRWWSPRRGRRRCRCWPRRTPGSRRHGRRARRRSARAPRWASSGGAPRRRRGRPGRAPTSGAGSTPTCTSRPVSTAVERVARLVDRDPAALVGVVADSWATADLGDQLRLEDVARRSSLVRPWRSAMMSASSSSRSIRTGRVARR